MAKYSKLYAAIMSMALVVGESMLVPENVRLWIQLGTLAAGAGGVWYFPNVTLPKPAESARDTADEDQPRDVDELEVG